MTTPASEHPGHDIRARRQALGWSQAKLAEQSGFGVRTVRRVEAGEGDHEERTIARLRHTLGLPDAGTPESREELIEWALDQANLMQLLAAFTRRLGQSQAAVALPEQNLRLPRRDPHDTWESGAGG